MLSSAEAFAGRIPGVPAGRARPTVYAHQDGDWVQFWMFFAGNTQDRGVLRTGRHAGDWEMVQFRIDPRTDQPVEAVYSQHSGAERCPWSAVVRGAGDRPLVFLAHGSHASYFRPGVRDRTWPDPNDETGVGAPVVPRVEIFGAAWSGYRGRWGGASARWFVPGEQSSPLSPALQGERWDAARWAARARPCTFARCTRAGACDGTETAIAWGAVALAALAVGTGMARRRRRVRRAERSARRSR